MIKSVAASEPPISPSFSSYPIPPTQFLGLVARRFLGPVARQFRGLVGPPVCRSVQRQTLALQERRISSAILGTSVDDPTSQSQRSRCFPAVASRRKEEVTLNLLSTGQVELGS